MGGRKRKRGRKTAAPGSRRAWQPMRPGRAVISPALLEHAGSCPETAAVLQDVEVWLNDRYVVVVRRFPDGAVQHLSVRRADRKPLRDWRDLQRIKNEIAGPHIEAVELFPDEDRLVDTANQYHLWCFPPGVRLQAGFTERSVLSERELPDIGARQRDPER